MNGLSAEGRRGIEGPPEEERMPEKILIAEDDPALQQDLALFLETHGYTTVLAMDGATALRLVSTEKPDLVVLDLALQNFNSLEACRQLRTRTYIPIIILSAKSDVMDRVLGLEMGADDYLTKPFHERELLARVRASLRRATVYNQLQWKQDILQVGDLRIDKPAREVTVGNRRITLTPKEYDLLCLLASNAGRVLERDLLLDKVWGGSAFMDSRTLDVHIHRLRSKIEPVRGHPQYLLTVPGVGYKLVAVRR
jgi:DNA-binding response OmpR family regulator